MRERIITPGHEIIHPDSLSVADGSITIYDNQTIVPQDLYHYIDSLNAIKIDSTLMGKRLTIRYRVFPEFIEQEIFHKDTSMISRGEVLKSFQLERSQSEEMAGRLTESDQLQKNGNISRGISIGNRQDMVVNSNLNLQLSGKLTDNLNLEAVITDNNIPIQPEGYSQNIQDFDNVFIRLYTEELSVTGGDVKINQRNQGYMSMYKKGLGAKAAYQWEHDSLNRGFETFVAAMVNKGRYNRQQIQGVEGNQGPYKLTGSDNEQFIIVLAGSEKVYIDGQLQQRGIENDYIMDYNAAEITFTANQLITKDKRIIVEFEYSEQNYARFSILNKNTFRQKSNQFWLNIYTEQDNKNQAYQEELTDEEKEQLRLVGDDVEKAYISGVRRDTTIDPSVTPLYSKKFRTINDSLVTYYEYSTNADSAIYFVSFTYVGEGRGDYIKSTTQVNARVFEFVGTGMGNYLPLRKVATPKKHQLIQAGGHIKLSPYTALLFDLGLSNYDNNTYSELDGGDNTGMAFNIKLDQHLLKDTNKNDLFTKVEYEFLSQNLQTVQRYRPVEFERDWNLDQADLNNDQHMIRLSTGYRHKKNISTDYTMSSFQIPGNYKGFKNSVNLNSTFSDFRVEAFGSYLKSKDTLFQKDFARYSFKSEKSLKWFTPGIYAEGEQNLWRDQDDSVSMESFAFNTYGITIQSPQTIKNEVSLSYDRRTDYAVQNNELTSSTLANTVRMKFGIKSLKNQKLTGTISYRDLNILDSTLTETGKEQNILIRTTYRFRAFKGGVSGNTLYESGSGLQQKTEFYYRKVAKGMGKYVWIDNNNNGVAEILEFEPAKFQDEADYIRVYAQSNEYEKVFNNMLSQSLNIAFARLINSENRIAKVVKRVSNQSAYSVSAKTRKGDKEIQMNPYAYLKESNELINLKNTFRNTLSYNKASRKFALNYIYLYNRNKDFLISGLNDLSQSSHSANARIGLIDAATFSVELGSGEKQNKNDASSFRNYDIASKKFKTSLLTQLLLNLQFDIGYKYAYKSNTLDNQDADTGNEILHAHELETDLQYNMKTSGSINMNARLVQNNFTGGDNYTTVSNEMMQGLQSGLNGLWEIRINRKIAGGLELNLNYSGRKSEGSRVIHTGGMQARYLF